jgi:hypothetical protein
MQGAKPRTRGQNFLDVCDGRVRGVSRGHVVEDEQRAGDELKNKEERDESGGCAYPRVEAARRFVEEIFERET